MKICYIFFWFSFFHLEKCENVLLSQVFSFPFRNMHNSVFFFRSWLFYNEMYKIALIVFRCWLLIYKFPKICLFYICKKYFIFCRCCCFLQIWSFTFRNMEEFIIFFRFCLFSFRNMRKCFIFVRFCLLYFQICCIFFRFCFLYVKMFHFLLILLSYVQICKNA